MREVDRRGLSLAVGHTLPVRGLLASAAAAASDFRAVDELLGGRRIRLLLGVGLLDFSPPMSPVECIVGGPVPLDDADEVRSQGLPYLLRLDAHEMNRVHTHLDHAS